jgi:orotate phosphoribosyltransferase
MGRQIEGPFAHGDVVAVADDVITTGGSTLKAIEAVEREGGRVAFVICLVNREEGGQEAIEARGYPVVSAFRKSEFL